MPSGLPAAAALKGGADPSRVAVGGDSAGANLAAIVAIEKPHGAAPSAQLLIYPATDGVTERQSWESFRDGFVLTMRDRDAFFRYYGGDAPPDVADPRISPLRAGSLAGLAPAVVAIAGFDPLRDEGEAFASALEAAGTPVRVLRFPSLEHGFIHLTGISNAARRAVRDIASGYCEVLARNIAEPELAHSAEASRFYETP